MWRLSLAFVDIALHRRGPEDLPASQFLFGLILVCYFAVGLAVLQIREPASSALRAVVFEGAVYMGFVWILLHLFGHSARFLQTASALLGTEIFLNLIAAPLVLWIELAGDADPAPIAPTLLFPLIILWGIDIAGFVLSRALQLPYIVGVLIVIGYLFGSLALRGVLFPAAA